MHLHNPSPGYQLWNYLSVAFPKQANEIRRLTTNTLKSAKTPTPNLTKSEQKALQDIRKRKDILILPADKGNMTVIMDRNEYVKKVHDLLDNTTYRTDTYYEQVSGAAMGSPISPVVADIYMEYLENYILNNAPLKPSQWFRYVDDTFVVWSHGREKLGEFLDYINSLDPNIQFTMEIENPDRSLPFLDTLITRKADGTLGHKVYRKPTHTNRYQPALAKKKTWPMNWNTLGLRYNKTVTPDRINRTIDRLTNQTTKPTHKHTTDTHDKEHATTFLPYIQGTTDRIGRILRKHNIRTVFTTHTKIGQLLTSPKDPQPQLSTPGVYKIPCSCGQIYIGETGRSVNTRLTEHECCARLGYI
ncbi:uncharacterized protein LOC105662853 [Megachile rotundata]|uniref:uncharacterized protein LOC105662853 n=1 Tax=Megachile rotundata TaxID=143995 RepID=UPI003FD217CA